MKRQKLLFWIPTIIIVLFEGVMPLFTFNSELAREGLRHLGYPAYFGFLLVVFKVFGVLALAIPQVPGRVKEWAYAGFGFDFISASVSHWVVDGFGMLMAFPGCAEQHRHRDGGSLFPETPLSAILPAYALTVLIPLIDVGQDNGQTAFLPGTHRYPPGSQDLQPVAMPLPRGSCIVWNFETMHWGLPNRSDQPRPALYITLCRPFWTDMKNFGGTARTKLLVDEDVVPLLDRRFARASGGGKWVHAGLGKVLRKVGEQPAT